MLQMLESNPENDRWYLKAENLFVVVNNRFGSLITLVLVILQFLLILFLILAWAGKTAIPDRLGRNINDLGTLGDITLLFWLSLMLLIFRTRWKYLRWAQLALSAIGFAALIGILATIYFLLGA
ncbi:MAG: hypothetical protein ACK49R_13930, partial [Planctomycetota bacterium]